MSFNSPNSSASSSVQVSFILRVSSSLFAISRMLRYRVTDSIGLSFLRNLARSRVASTSTRSFDFSAVTHYQWKEWCSKTPPFSILKMNVWKALYNSTASTRKEKRRRKIGPIAKTNRFSHFHLLSSQQTPIKRITYTLAGRNRPLVRILLVEHLKLPIQVLIQLQNRR